MVRSHPLEPTHEDIMINQNVKASISIAAEQYANAKPFPHIVIDNFLSDTTLNTVLTELQNYQHWHTDKTDYVKGYQVNKFYTPSAESDVLESLSELKQNAPVTMNVLDYLKTRETLDFLENLTQIKGLLGDNDWLGGGVHKITKGGKLGVHADFNVHWKMNVHRRLNLLIYLNKDWKKEYNGYLELWEKDMSRCSVMIKPVFNRAVIFNITDDAFHGHPVPLNTPADVARYSLAMYYYTEERPEHEKSPQHPVLWRDT